MPSLHQWKRHKTVFGDLYQSNAHPKKVLLITPQGKRLKSKYAGLIRGLVSPRPGHELIDPSFHSRFLDQGGHAQVYLIPRSKLSAFQRSVHRHPKIERVVNEWVGKDPHELVVKVYHPHLKPGMQIEGLTQVTVEMDYYNHLKRREKKGKNKTFIPHAPPYYFAAREGLVRGFINAPSAGDLLLYLKEFTNPGSPHRSTVERMLRKTGRYRSCLSNEQMNAFIKKNRITQSDIQSMIDEVKHAFSTTEYKPRQTIPPSLTAGHREQTVPDLWEHDHNIFVLGRHPNGKLRIIVHDQPRKGIENIVELLKNSPPRPRQKKKK